MAVECYVMSLHIVIPKYSNVLFPRVYSYVVSKDYSLANNISTLFSTIFLTDTDIGEWYLEYLTRIR